MRTLLLDKGEALFRAACGELDAGLRAGTLSRAEEMFAKHPSLSEDAERGVELVFTEFLVRESQGLKPEPAEYYQRFPQWRDRLERLFQVDDLLKDSIVNPLSITEAESGGHRQAAVARSKRDRFAGYELLEKLGSGGMGVVHKAIQPGLKRVVALKTLRAGSDASAQILARFRREAELTAKLRHPNIVPVFEVGEDNGEPYLAMEYVPGGTLRDHLRNKSLPAAEAARLSETLARAVAYAHAEGVIHRDLKPGNILLAGTSEDGKGSRTVLASSPLSGRPSPLDPRITDFGLAVGRDHPSALTRQGQIVGTPSYMAPEQAAGRSDATLPAVDIYSLGAILYECLTGRPPFLAETEIETLLQIAERDPVRPRQLQPRIPRDLETICLKCLYKDPAKRYSTAGELADDIGRFRAGDSIRARPAGLVENSGKWIRGHPSAAMAVAAGLLVMVGFLVVTAVYTSHLKATRDGAELDAARAVHNAKLAEEAGKKAENANAKLQASLAAEERQRRNSRAVLDGVVAEVVDEWLLRLPALNEAQREFLDKLLKDYESLASNSPDDDASRLGLARATTRVANMRRLIGRVAEAEKAYARARELFESLGGKDPEFASCLGGLAILREAEGNMAESVPLREQALRLREEHSKLHPEDAAARLAALGTRNQLAFGLILASRPAEALKILESTGQWADGVSVALRMELAISHNARGQAQYDLQKFDAAGRDFRQSIELAEEILLARPETPGMTSIIGRSAVHLASIQMGGLDKSSAQALETATKAEAALAGLVAAYPGLPGPRVDLGKAQNIIGVLEANAGQFDKAEKSLRNSISTMQAALKIQPSRSPAEDGLGGAHCNLALALRGKRDLSGSIQMFDQALDLLRSRAESPGNRTARAFAYNAATQKARTLSMRAADEREAAKEASIAEAVESLRYAASLNPRSIRTLVTGHPDWKSLREDAKGREFLKGLDR